MAPQKNLPELFFSQAKQRLNERAFYYCRQRDQKWVDMTWKKYRDEVIDLALWLQQKGIKPGDRVALLSSNRPEWIIADLAILSIGAVCVPIYATASPADMAYILQHSESKLLMVDYLERLETARDSALPDILVFDRASKKLAESFPSTVDMLGDARKIGRDKRQGKQLPVALKDEDIAKIIYTSGTTGHPKGVVHTHGNFKAAAKVVKQYLQHPEGGSDRFFSFLPLSHVAEMVLVELGSIVTGQEIAFARSIDTLNEDLLRCRPTILLCVPRLWEKIYEKIQSGLLLASPLKKAVFSIGELLGDLGRVDGDQIYGGKPQISALAKASDLLVGDKLRQRLGLDRVRMFLTGAAPTRAAVMKFFGSFGIMIREVYGLTENLCLGVLNDPDMARVGRCGKPFAGGEMKLGEDGEILFRAPWNFKGYFKNEAATKEAMTDDGWLATGDLGEIDSEGFLKIVGRKKELLKTSGGKYIAPVPIEDKLKALPIIKDAMLVGDERKYCVALVSLNPENLEGADPKSKKNLIRDYLKEVNEPLASFETVKRVGVMSDEFSVEAGTLTPTLKVKRKVVLEKQAKFIETLYGSSDPVIYQDDTASQ